VPQHLIALQYVTSLYDLRFIIILNGMGMKGHYSRYCDTNHDEVVQFEGPTNSG